MTKRLPTALVAATVAIAVGMPIGSAVSAARQNETYRQLDAFIEVFLRVREN